MKNIIVVTNPKGGVGKTMTAVNLAAGLAIHNKKVLLVDNDPKGNATINLLTENTKLINTTRSLYYGKLIKNAIYPSVVSNLDIVPSNIDLATVELDLTLGSDKFTLLKKALNSRSISIYDYVIIDTPPSLGLLVFNSLMAAERLIIPIHGFYSIEDLGLYKFIIADFQKENTNLEIDSIVMTMVESNTIIAREIRTIVEEVFGDKVCKTDIPKNVKFDEAPSHKKSIYDYAPGSYAAIQHMKLVDELLKKWEDKVIGLDKVSALRKSVSQKRFTDKSVEFIASIATSIERKKKEKSVHLGASVYELEMEYINETMAMLQTTNVSEATRFLLLAAWIAYGPEIQKRIAKNDIKRGI